MHSQYSEIQNAEERFRQAFERLKLGQPKVLMIGTPITQNNVAREAGCDPSALKKARFPDLVRQIQAYIQLHKKDHHHSTSKKNEKRAINRSTQERLKDAIRQRDQVQSILASANMRIIELSELVQSLQRQLEEARPSATWRSL